MEWKCYEMSKRRLALDGRLVRLGRKPNYQMVLQRCARQERRVRGEEEAKILLYIPSGMNDKMKIIK